jgi:hypothetical protein
MPRKAKKTGNAKIEAFKEKIETLRKELQGEMSKALTEGFGELWAKYPNLQSIGWRQYSPYFNDGDECVFSAHVDSYSLYVNGKDLDGYDGDEEDEDAAPLSTAEQEEIADAAAEILEAFDNDFFQTTWGNHVKVTLRRDGTSDVDEYYHD